jgi:hypothetical protein
MDRSCGVRHQGAENTDYMTLYKESQVCSAEERKETQNGVTQLITDSEEQDSYNEGAAEWEFQCGYCDAIKLSSSTGRGDSFVRIRCKCGDNQVRMHARWKMLRRAHRPRGFSDLPPPAPGAEAPANGNLANLVSLQIDIDAD